MKNTNTQIEAFTQELLLTDTAKAEILLALREKVFTLYPHVEERMMYGGIMFTLETDFGGLFASKKHISFEFSNGYLFDDPENILEGTGKYRRHIKFQTLEDIESKKIETFLKQI